MNKVGQNKYLPILSILFLALIWLVYRLTIAFNQTPELMNGETNNIWNALKVISGKPIYTNPEAIPYEIFQYTPLSQIPIILLAWIENKLFHTEDFVFTLTAGRLLSIIYNLITAYLIYKILKNHFKSQIYLAVLGGLTFICFLPHHFFAIRPDSLALLFTVGGIYFFTEGYFLERNKSFVLSAITLAFSFFVKQDAFLISGAFGLILLFTKNIKGLFMFCLTFFCSIGILLLFATLLFGPYFFNSIFGGVALEMKFDQFTYVLSRYFTFYYLFLILFFYSLYFIFKNWNTLIKQVIFFVITLMITFLFAGFTSFKVGSHFNYYELPTIIALFLVVYVLNHKFNFKKNGFNLLSILGFVYVLSLHFMYFQYYHYTSLFLKNNLAKSSRISFIANNKEIFTELKNSKVNICSYDNRARIMLNDEIILPNSEFYGISRFSYKDFDNTHPKKQIKIIILPKGLILKDTDLGRFVRDFKSYEIWKKTPELDYYKLVN
jgi:hypothetical protein